MIVTTELPISEVAKVVHHLQLQVDKLDNSIGGLLEAGGGDGWNEFTSAILNVLQSIDTSEAVLLKSVVAIGLMALVLLICLSPMLAGSCCARLANCCTSSFRRSYRRGAQNEGEILRGPLNA